MYECMYVCMCRSVASSHTIHLRYTHTVAYSVGHGMASPLKVINKKILIYLARTVSRCQRAYILPLLLFLFFNA